MELIWLLLSLLSRNKKDVGPRLNFTFLYLGSALRAMRGRVSDGLSGGQPRVLREAKRLFAPAPRIKLPGLKKIHSISATSGKI